ncbi:MAG TPA: ATP-binding protein [Lapillicoccus sp.]
MNDAGMCAAGNPLVLERIVVLAGPSGAGKSRLAARLQAAYGWPVVRLDDFYRNGDDPALPTRELGGTTIVDWDDPASWNAAAAVAALEQIVRTGSVEVPVYDIARSAAVGTARVDAPPDALVVAEGIFAAEILKDLGDAGILQSAWCVRHQRWVTFVRRLVRDLAERRKPPLVLLRRGLALSRAEPAIIARMDRLGATCATPLQVERRLRAALGPLPRS